MSKIIFFGGIHGAGKSTLCDVISKHTGYIHITASEILKWNTKRKAGNKNVENIQLAQNELISGLNKVLKRNYNYLIDGHFCLFNEIGEIEKIPLNTFQRISPNIIAIVTSRVEYIKDRLKKRDGKLYDCTLLKKMQTSELEYARVVSLELSVPFVEIRDGNYESLIEIL